MFCGTIFLFALLLALKTDAQIPKPCAGIDEMTERKCCPTPNVTNETDPGPCGVNIGRGSCQDVTGIGDYTFTNDVRKTWPLGYFNRTCVCSEKFGGYDCGECSFAYSGDDCSQKANRMRTSLATLTEKDWKEYHDILNLTRNSSSRYMVVTTSHTQNVTDLVDSMVNPTLYELFVWMHHFVAKDSELMRDKKDFAHEATGFPTWHRLFLLWLEREIQILTNKKTFTLHYWDWRDPGQRTAYFTENRLGANNNNNSNGTVERTLFQDWNTTCWVERNNEDPFIPICNPTKPTAHLRRCPDETACESNNIYWPTFCDVKDAVSIQDYDVDPYDIFIEENMSFRSYMEGFIKKESGYDCDSDKFCKKEKDRKGSGDEHPVVRKLHNSVHVILGIGDFRKSFSFAETGVMGDVAASPSDPIFINHHTMIDCILEAWLQQQNKENLGESGYPSGTEIPEGHKANHYIVPFIPLYNHSQMFNTADNFGYECTLPQLQIASCDPDPDPSPETDDPGTDDPATNNPGNKAESSTAGQVYLASLLAALLSILFIGTF